MSLIATHEATSTEWPRDLLRVTDLTGVGLEELLDLAADSRSDPRGWAQKLPGASVACLIERASPRACSLEAAAGRLGMIPIRLRPDDLVDLEAGPAADEGRILSSYSVAVLARAERQSTVERIAELTSVPVINALTEEHDPCQAIADLLTLRERFGGLQGLTVAYVGVAGSAANSLIEAGALSGMHIRMACPPDGRPPFALQTEVEVLADLHDGTLEVVDDPWQASDGADAIYTAAWPAGRPRDERLRRYRVDGRLMHHAKPNAVFMHALPARRGEEVSALVIDGPHSVVWRQVENRLRAEEAALWALIRAAEVAA